MVPTPAVRVDADVVDYANAARGVFDADDRVAEPRHHAADSAADSVDSVGSSAPDDAGFSNGFALG